MIYVYPNGMKIRKDYESSRGDRWLIGGVKDNIWRSEACDEERVRTVWITEGESDLITLMENRDEKHEDAYIAFAGASGRLTQVEAYRIGADRHVLLLLDNDKAGHECEMEARAMFKAEGAWVYTIDWDRITMQEGKTFNDLGDLPEKVLKNIDTYMMGV
jgi:5S rRNA maturation endonuclease (ribonuclease M5)